ncbi:hypothetical protein BDB00DRAFT_357880 [Zychaea mexicana]|uniref:uncharacterized protein n=1 Tax=Zychaea mexicana TaxID=64656 RepID=UPI0022FEC3E8|nr:uncharacterized protein BDB00DRAFT_357880 [Zychaea mexicana]KAI9493833.1 hypothetical protein BDB00DRAFT_357880 [Zychaea mexicana]
MFIDPASTHLHTARMGQQFLEFLESLVSSDIPAVLQMHGKVLQGDRHLPVQKFISAVKTRLMELGLDQSLRTHPTSIYQPVQITQQQQQQQDRYHHHQAGTNNHHLGIGGSSSSGISKNAAASGNGNSHYGAGNMATQEKTVETILTSFQKSGLIPKSLLEDAIFRPLWFKKTFLPALLQWQGNSDLLLARDQLMAALKERKKISDQVYNDYLKQQQQQQIK